MKNKGLWFVLIVVGIIAIFAAYRIVGAPSFGGTTNYDTVEATGLAIGSGCNDSFATCLGTTQTAQLTGTCTLVSDTSAPATSTVTATCSTPGTVAGDQVFVQLATTSTAISRNWVIVGTVAGTDTTTVRLLNLTGQAAVFSATNSLGSSSPYWVSRD